MTGEKDDPTKFPVAASGIQPRDPPGPRAFTDASSTGVVSCLVVPLAQAGWSETKAAGDSVFNHRDLETTDTINAGTSSLQAMKSEIRLVYASLPQAWDRLPADAWVEHDGSFKPATGIWQVLMGVGMTREAEKWWDHVIRRDDRSALMRSHPSSLHSRRRISRTEARGVVQFVMDPEASVSALVFHHPQARYFSVGEGAGA